MRSKLLDVVTALLLVSGAASATMGASPDGIYRFRPGLHISRERPPNKKEITALLSGLGYWTGMKQIELNADGDLNLGDRTRVAGGSPIARELLIAAADSQDSFTIENWNQSAAIAFAQIEATDRYLDGSGERHYGWKLRIDFADFAELRGKPQVLVAFDPAINMLHELAHGILGYFDPLDDDDQLGDCERYINRIRNELGLPERDYYYPRRAHATVPDGKTAEPQGVLTFISADGAAKSKDEFVVTFNLESVVDLSKAKSRSAIHSDLLAQRGARN